MNFICKERRFVWIYALHIYFLFEYFARTYRYTVEIWWEGSLGRHRDHARTVWLDVGRPERLDVIVDPVKSRQNVQQTVVSVSLHVPGAEETWSAHTYTHINFEHSLYCFQNKLKWMSELRYFISIFRYIPTIYTTLHTIPSCEFLVTVSADFCIYTTSHVPCHDRWRLFLYSSL